jgi:tetratricopeptide (TPR) repeat protein
MMRSKISSACVSACLIASSFCQWSSAETPQRAVILNNEGVAILGSLRMRAEKEHETKHTGALGFSQWKQALDKFRAALKIDPKFKEAEDNLGIAYNNYGLYETWESDEAGLRQFHRALYYAGKNETTVQNMHCVIRHMGKDPNKFVDRVELGDKAVAINDLPGAVVEYRAALILKNDGPTHQKLAQVYKRLDQPTKESLELKAAQEADRSERTKPETTDVPKSQLEKKKRSGGKL